VSTREQPDQDLVHDLVVADDDLVNLAIEPLVAPNEGCRPLLGHDPSSGDDVAPAVVEFMIGPRWEASNRILTADAPSWSLQASNG